MKCFAIVWLIKNVFGHEKNARGEQKESPNRKPTSRYKFIFLFLCLDILNKYEI